MTGLDFDVNDGVARLWLNRPSAGNSVGPDLAGALVDATESLRQRQDVAVVVLGAAGKAFCVGGDLGFFAGADDAGAAIYALAGQVHAALLNLAAIDAPLVARVQGAAAGIGLSLVCAADVVVAGAAATFTAAYGAVGLSPDGGQSWTLPRLVGQRRAAELILTNRRVGADEAARIGLITEAVGDEELDARVDEVVARLRAASTPALGAARRLLHRSATSTFEDHLAAEAASIASLAGSADGREGVAAFVAKRRPEFGHPAEGPAQISP